MLALLLMFPKIYTESTKKIDVFDYPRFQRTRTNIRRTLHCQKLESPAYIPAADNTRGGQKVLSLTHLNER